MSEAACLFCRIVTGEAAAHLVAADEAAVAFLDTRPVFPGHTLVVPRRHVPTLVDLDDGLLVPLFGLARRVAAAMPEALGAGGTFVAMNNTISQSVPHLHVHVVPRRRGDGLRGFFWPRQRYADGEIEQVAGRIRAALPPGV